MISLDIKLLKDLVSEDELASLQPAVNAAAHSLHSKTCPGNDFLGWMDLPENPDRDEIDRIKAIAAEIQFHSQVLVVIGIGGSYLGARSSIEALRPTIEPSGSGPRIVYLGHHMSAEYTVQLLDFLQDKSYSINVISKSGTTTEPAVAFRILKEHLGRRYQGADLSGRIFATTDRASGALRKMADTEGYRSFMIPDNVGGRFSVLTAVGLLPIAVAGIDIEALLSGAADMARHCRPDALVLENPALTYASARTLLNQRGKTVEILAVFEPCMQYLAEWWKQLYGESEGKNTKGIFPASVVMSTDLHSLGQYIQEGARTLFETFIMLKRSPVSCSIPYFAEDLDGMNYLSGMDLSEVNYQAYRATSLAHYAGGVPNMTFHMPDKNAYYLGQLYYLFEYAVALSGLLLGVNPFDQPGVEAYKKNMFALLGKPGFDKQRNELENLVKSLG